MIGLVLPQWMGKPIRGAGALRLLNTQGMPLQLLEFGGEIVEAIPEEFQVRQGEGWPEHRCRL